ncbi:MAG: serine/threonine protein kinase [Deltaproteobacteria bacterium]|nr:serine/threonine protein kinase [Deltaproteobacteria bacterium]
MVPQTWQRAEKVELTRLLSANALTEIFEGRFANRAVLAHVITSVLNADERAIQTLLAWASALRRVQHPALLQLEGVGLASDNRPVLAYAFVPGADLATLARGQRGLPPAQVVATLRPICEALDVLHDQGLIHGALRAASVWIASDGPGTPRLGHLGLEALLPKPDVRQTQNGPPPGVGCAAPEVIDGCPADARSDVYLLGTVLYEALTGEVLFGEGTNQQQLLAHLTAEPPPLPERARHLEAVVRRCLAKAPGARFATMAEVSEALQQAHDGRGMEANAAKSATKVGDVLGTYELVDELGQGSMGHVFLAKHTKLGRQVAIKVLRPEHAQNDELVRRFFQEAQAVNQINHEHIVQILDFAQEPAASGGRVYCVMELLTGASLTQVLKAGPIPLSRLLPLVAQVARALDAAHQRGVVHRDIKPDNIFVMQKPDGRSLAKVLDFGVAKSTGTQVTITQSGTVVGTPTYMSPEQAASLEVDHRSDIYALGTVLYEALAGAPPFTSQAFGQLVVQIITHKPPPLESVTPGGEPIPEGLSTLVARCLEKEAEARPQTMGEVAVVLESLSRDASAGPPTPRKAGRTPLMLGGLGAVAAIGLGAFFLLKPPPTPVAAPAPAPVVAAPAMPVVAPPAPAPAPVQWKLASSPPGAQVVRADTGEVLGVTPLEKTVPATGTAVTLKLSLPGYEPAERSVRADADTSLEVALTPLPKREEAAPKPKPKRVRKPVSDDGTVDPFAN